jgi:hypothetical protein
VHFLHLQIQTNNIHPVQKNTLNIQMACCPSQFGLVLSIGILMMAPHFGTGTNVSQSIALQSGIYIFKSHTIEQACVAIWVETMVTIMCHHYDGDLVVVVPFLWS